MAALSIEIRADMAAILRWESDSALRMGQEPKSQGKRKNASCRHGGDDRTTPDRCPPPFHRISVCVDSRAFAGGVVSMKFLLLSFAIVWQSSGFAFSAASVQNLSSPLRPI